MRKVTIPIYVKLAIVVLLLLSGSLLYYVYYATDLFTKDKTAYVYETVDSQSKTMSKSISEKLLQTLSGLTYLEESSLSSRGIKVFFDHNSFIESYAKFTGKKTVLSFTDKSAQVDWKELKNFIAENVLEESGMLYHSQMKKLVFFKKKGNKLSVLIANEQLLLSLIDQSLLYDYYLINSEKNIKIDLEGKGLKLEGAIDNLQLNNNSGTQVAIVDSKRYVLSYQKIPLGNYKLLLFVEEEKILEASRLLKEKSLYFGLFILSITAILLALFSKYLTAPIRKLFVASQDFAKQNFEKRVVVSSHDEIGVLADSFNHMADEIVGYMEQMKEKHRLENELKTAKLVQKSFFPKNSKDAKWFDLQAFYKPATECGGDWWGSIETEDRLVIILIDATGHGTPAALVTAVVHNCLTALEYLGKYNPEFLSSTKVIMDYLNKSICSVGERMMATGFVMAFEKGKNQVKYSNASHNPPFYFTPNESLNKNDFAPLMDALSERLGEKKETEFLEVSMDVSHNGKFVFYTDGLTEGESPDGKQWGKRNFLKSLISLGNSTTKDMVEGITENAYSFYAGRAQDDDISIVAVGLKNG